MPQLIKKFIGEIILTGGIGFFTYGIFNFSFQKYGGKGGLLPSLGSESTNIGVAYYYDDSVLFMITIGAILITVGILIIKNRQKQF